MSLTWLLWRMFSFAMLLLFWVLLSAAGLAALAPQGQQQAAVPPEIEAAARTFVRELAEGRFAEAAGRFDENLTRAMPVTRLEETWKAVQAQAGAWQEITGVSYSEAQGYRIADVTCRFASTPLVVRVAFDSSGRIGGLFFRPAAAPAAAWSPAASVKPDAFHERAMTVGAAPWELPGTLTLPKGEGPFAAVVLVHGSGPHDRDETIGPNKPFKDLAWGLASRGIAVLRYEKRTKVHGAQVARLEALTAQEETVADAQHAVALLATQPEIDARRIFVAGHSLGAMLAPRIAAGQQHVAGLIVMAGNTRPLEVLLVEQMRYLAELDGKVDETEQQRIEAVERLAQQIRSPDLQPEEVLDLLGAKVPGSYWLDLRDYQPAQAAAALDLPVLVLQGERDYQVRMADFEGWKQALKGRGNAQFKSYPLLNHLFIAGSGPGSPQEYAQPGHVAEEVIVDIAAWIAAQKPKP
jgi:dienelactone hydrolase